MSDRSRILFINVGHGLDHLFLLLYPTVVLTLEGVFGRSYGELLSLAVPGFIAFAAGTLPAGLARRSLEPAPGCSRSSSSASVLRPSSPGSPATPFELGAGRSHPDRPSSRPIYHPVGIAMLVEGRSKVGKLLGVNGVAGKPRACGGGDRRGRRSAMRSAGVRRSSCRARSR